MTTNAIDLIAAERARHPRQYDGGELAWAACYYAMPGEMLLRFRDWGEDIHEIPVHPDAFFRETGWHYRWAKRGAKTRIRQLVVAGALIAAEIDRLSAMEANRD